MKARSRNQRKRKWQGEVEPLPQSRQAKRVTKRRAANSSAIVTNVSIELPSRVEGLTPTDFGQSASSVPFDHSHFPIAKTSWVGINQKRVSSEYTLEKLRAEGFGYFSWDAT